jgi:hypothetical protein
MLIDRAIEEVSDDLDLDVDANEPAREDGPFGVVPDDGLGDS